MCDPAERARKLERRPHGLEREALLTATEQAIAALAAAGYTNGEIARLMQVSVKTVEWNLSKVYRTLGVRSRTDLALRAAWSDGPGISRDLEREP